jgi:hypothetical protein
VFFISVRSLRFCCFEDWLVAEDWGIAELNVVVRVDQSCMLFSLPLVNYFSAFDELKDRFNNPYFKLQQMFSISNLFPWI